MKISTATVFEVVPIFASLEEHIHQRNNLAYLIAHKPDFSGMADMTLVQRKPFNDYRAKCVQAMKLRNVPELSPEEITLLLPGRLAAVERTVKKLLHVLETKYAITVLDNQTEPEHWLVRPVDEAKVA